MTRRLLLLLLSAVLVVPALAAAPAQADRGDRADRKLARIAACAVPRLAPALAAERGRVRGLGAGEQRRAVRALRQAAGLDLPARGQAILLMVLVESRHLERLRLGDQVAPDVTRLARRLRAVRGWQTLPPEIVAHRLLGTPDPYAFEDGWAATLHTLARLTGGSERATARAVMPGARAERSCRPKPGRAYPLPVGSGFDLLRRVPAPVPAKAVAKARAAAETGKKPAGRPGTGEGQKPARRQDGSESLLLGASCGVPVLAASAGEVAIHRKDRTSGPWSITVSDGEVRTTYRHVSQPVVAPGEKVRAGDQLASVGDLGWIDRCALDFELAIGGTVLRPEEVATWLAPEPVRSGPSATEPVEGADTGATTSLRIATFNVLGAHLTGPGSDRPSYRPGGARMAAAMGHLNASGASIALFQEFESPQAAVVSASPGWQLHRATPNSSFRDGNSSGNAVAWRTDTWELVSASEFTVPWQVRLHMPVVHLRHRVTGAMVAVVGVHNPASTAKQGNQARSRGVARAIEKQAVASIHAQTGVPVLLGGDMNERSEAICDFARSGLRTWGSGCRGYGGVDHVFVSGDAAMTGLDVNRATLGSVSDHPMVVAGVTINP